MEYDFLGSPLRRHLAHRKGTGTVSEDPTYTYDDSERLLEVRHSLDGGTPVLLARNTYDELGRLSGTERGGNNALSSREICYLCPARVTSPPRARASWTTFR